MLRKSFAGFAALLLVIVAAEAQTSPVIAASDANDVVALEKFATTAATADERTLAKGAALSLRHRDAAAIDELETLAQGAGDKDLRAAAYLALSTVYVRQSRFSDLCAVMEAAKGLRTKPFTTDEEQTLDFAKSLVGVAPMKLVHKASGSVPVTRDAAGLARIPVTVNGKQVAAVVDSGAGFSTLSESTAKKLGVRMLDRATVVGSASLDTVHTKVGVIQHLKVGDAELTDVVVVVLADKDLSFMGGVYTIDAIVGLPVFEALGRIELAKDKDGEAFRYGPKKGERAIGNLILAGVEPIILTDGPDVLRMFVDTGANHTTLNASMARDFPKLAEGGAQDTARLAGAGGISEDAKAITLPGFHLSIAGRGFDLRKISMRSKIEPGRHGAIGQDLLKQGSRWWFDFETMSFAIDE